MVEGSNNANHLLGFEVQGSCVFEKHGNLICLMETCHLPTAIFVSYGLIISCIANFFFSEQKRKDSDNIDHDAIAHRLKQDVVSTNCVAFIFKTVNLSVQ